MRGCYREVGSSRSIGRGGQAWWDVQTRTTKTVDDLRSQKQATTGRRTRKRDEREGYSRPVMMKFVWGSGASSLEME